DGQFVEVHPDSLESDSARKARPSFKSDDGRVVYGGGAITPDLIVKPDTFSAAEQEFRKAIAPKNSVKPNFEVQPAWRDSLFTRVQKSGAKVDRKLYDAASKYVDRLIENR